MDLNCIWNILSYDSLFIILVDICSDDMMHYYTWVTNILQNLNKFFNDNINMWFLFFDFRARYSHSFHGVSMEEVVIRVTHIPRQRCAKVLLNMTLLLLSNTIC